MRFLGNMLEDFKVFAPSRLHGNTQLVYSPSLAERLCNCPSHSESTVFDQLILFLAESTYQSQKAKDIMTKYQAEDQWKLPSLSGLELERPQFWSTLMMLG